MIPPAPNTDPLPPAAFAALSTADQAGYRDLRRRVGSSNYRYNRYHRLDTLRDTFQQIRNYCLRGDADDSLRCLVCGTCWLSSDDIAINIRHLRILLNKSKSTINGALMKMKYNPVPLNMEERDRLTSLIPQLKDNYIELRLWSVRRHAGPDGALALPPTPVPAVPAPPNPFEFTDFDFEFFDSPRSPTGTDVNKAIVPGIELLGIVDGMQKAAVEDKVSQWERKHRSCVPKLLRWMFRCEEEKVEAQATTELEAPWETLGQKRSRWYDL